MLKKNSPGDGFLVDRDNKMALRRQEANVFFILMEVCPRALLEAWSSTGALAGRNFFRDPAIAQFLFLHSGPLDVLFFDFCERKMEHIKPASKGQIE